MPASNASVPELISEMIFVDLAKTPLLADAVDHAELVGTQILPYPGAGYLYCLLFYVPREWAPMKGYSTAVYYTSQMTHTAPENTHWGLAIGILEEIVLNFGYLLAFPILLFYGFLIGLCERFSASHPAFLAPTRLGAIWLIGQNLPVVLLLFVTMAGVILLLNYRYVPAGTKGVALS